MYQSFEKTEYYINLSFMLTSKKELDFYLKADMMMNRGYFTKPIIRRIHELWIPDEVMNYLRAMRKYSYYSNKSISLHGLRLYILKQLYYKRKFYLLGNKLGFSMGANSFGYGLVIHHPGTIVCGVSNVIGNYALINSSTCIVERGSEIGDGFFMGTGAVITKQVVLGKNVSVAANSVVNKSFSQEGVLIAGQPATVVREVGGAWFENLYGERWKDRHDKVERLKDKEFRGISID